MYVWWLNLSFGMGGEQLSGNADHNAIIIFLVFCMYRESRAGRTAACPSWRSGWPAGMI